MAESTFRTELWLPAPREAVFDFFANAANLQEITPPFLHFKVVTPLPIEMRVGALIDYKLRLRGFPLRWRTLISAWERPVRFVDEQLRGPYRYWIHEHTFRQRNGGTEISDFVRYSVRGGALVDRSFVRPDVERIFRYRADRMRELFARHSVRRTVESLNR